MTRGCYLRLLPCDSLDSRPPHDRSEHRHLLDRALYIQFSLVMLCRLQSLPRTPPIKSEACWQKLDRPRQRQHEPQSYWLRRCGRSLRPRCCRYTAQQRHRQHDVHRRADRSQVCRQQPQVQALHRPDRALRAADGERHRAVRLCPGRRLP